MASKIAINASDDYKNHPCVVISVVYLLPNNFKKSIKIDMFVTLLVMRLLEFHHGVQNGLYRQYSIKKSAFSAKFHITRNIYRQSYTDSLLLEMYNFHHPKWPP